MRKKCPYSGLFWSAFSRIRTEHGEIRSITPYSVRMRENVEQNNYKYGKFSGPELHYQFISLERLLRLYNFVKGKKRESRMNFTEAIIAMS